MLWRAQGLPPLSPLAHPSSLRSGSLRLTSPITSSTIREPASLHSDYSGMLTAFLWNRRPPSAECSADRLGNCIPPQSFSHQQGARRVSQTPSRSGDRESQSHPYWSFIFAPGPWVCCLVPRSVWTKSCDASWPWKSTPGGSKNASGRRRPNNYLFPAAQDLKRAWSSLKLNANVEFRMHGLWRTAITNLAQSGAPDTTLWRWPDMCRRHA